MTGTTMHIYKLTKIQDKINLEVSWASKLVQSDM